MNADGALGDAVVLLQGRCVRAVSSACSSQAAVKGSIALAKAPTSINRGAKEVCLLGLPWLDLRSSGTGCVITKVSAQLRGERGPGYLRRPLSFPLYSFSFVINHRNKCTDHKSGGQMQNQRDRDVSSKIKWFIQHVCSQSRGIYDSTVSPQPSNTFRKYWMYWFDYHTGRWRVVSHQWCWVRKKWTHIKDLCTVLKHNFEVFVLYFPDIFLLATF